MISSLLTASILATTTEAQKIPEKTAFSETGNPLNEKQPPKEPNTMSIRTATWKLIYNQYNDTKELYNLEEDPQEEQNLIGQNLAIELTLWNKLQKIQQLE